MFELNSWTHLSIPWFLSCLLHALSPWQVCAQQVLGFVFEYATYKEVSSGNQSSLSAAAKDTLHLTKIIIRRPLFCVTFWEVYPCGEEQSVYKVPCQTSPPSQRVILSLEDKPVLPGLQGLEKATCLSYKLVVLPIESSHFCTTTEMQIYSDISKWIPLTSQGRNVYSNEVLTTPWVTVGFASATCCCLCLCSYKNTESTMLWYHSGNLELLYKCMYYAVYIVYLPVFLSRRTPHDE